MPIMTCNLPLTSTSGSVTATARHELVAGCGDVNRSHLFPSSCQTIGLNVNTGRNVCCATTIKTSVRKKPNEVCTQFSCVTNCEHSCDNTKYLHICQLSASASSASRPLGHIGAAKTRQLGEPSVASAVPQWSSGVKP
jgi:hypothetical protein